MCLNFNYKVNLMTFNFYNFLLLPPLLTMNRLVLIKFTYLFFSRKFYLRSLGCDFFALLRFRLLAQKQPSSVVQKQHFEVVFVPPARFLRSLVRSRYATQKKDRCIKQWSFLQLAGATRLELATSAVTGQRSNQLNYTPAEQLCLINYVFLNCNTFFYFFSHFFTICVKTRFYGYNFIICLH